MTKKTDRWLLPEGIEAVLPEQARKLEVLRRRLIDLYDSWGYEQVMPPFIEYLDSLLTGTGHDLDLQTFKLTDQLTGQTMGVRADMTPQVARIDAHELKNETPSRLCYLGTVLHTRPDGFAGSRSPLQIGAELYGHAGAESDVEVMLLMVETLQATGISQAYIDLGHVGIFREMASIADLSADQETALFDALQRKASADVQSLLNEWKLDKALASGFMQLIRLNGGEGVLDAAREQLAGLGTSVKAALDNLAEIAGLFKKHKPEISLHYDLAELRGYNYHTGPVFAAYVAGRGHAVALGGRYDDIGKVFGRARPATGFSADLKTLVSLGNPQLEPTGAIFAPHQDDLSLFQAIEDCRQRGERVICALPGQVGNAADMGCNRQLVKTANGWAIEHL